MTRLAVLLCLLLALPVHAEQVRTERVHFAPGTSGAVLNGRIAGYDSQLYKLGATAGQTMRVRLTSPNTATYFNVYGPGSGPGDQALAVGQMVDPINDATLTLPASGEYTISVYMMRSAARRNEVADFTVELSIGGAAAEPPPADYADGLTGGPDFWEVTAGTLNLRAAPSGAAPVLTAYGRGEVLRNLGCRMAEGRRWCRVEGPRGGPEGWVAGDYLVEASAYPPTSAPVSDPRPYDAKVPGTDYHATGLIDCIAGPGQPMQGCPFGVIRGANGAARVEVDTPDGGHRVLTFFADGGVGSDAEVTPQWQREGDMTTVTLGSEVYRVPDAVIFGG